MGTYIRKRKDGGYSECSSPDELVGKGRCCHVLDISDGNGDLQLKKIQRGMYEVSINDSKLTIKAQEEVIANFFKEMPNIDENKIKNIIEFLEKE